MTSHHLALPVENTSAPFRHSVDDPNATARLMQPCLVGKKFMPRCASPNSPLDLRVGDEIELPHDRYLR
jgi:hypothetical protein